MSELVEWLRPLIVARKATAENCAAAHWVADVGPCIHVDAHTIAESRALKSLGYVGAIERAHDREHVALNDPRDTIARCDFELSVLDTYEQWKATATRDASKVDAVDVFAWVILRLATAYRHFDGYKEEWS